MKQATGLLAALLMAVAPGRSAGASRPVPLPSHTRALTAQEPAKVQLSEAEAAALPDTEGRETMAAMCVPCHGVMIVTAERRTRAGWTALVDDMLDKGAIGSDAQAETTVAYLTRHFPAVNVNTADAAELARVLKVSGEEAAAIVAYRGANPAFKAIDDLKRVPGVDPANLDKQRTAIIFRGK